MITKLIFSENGKFIVRAFRNGDEFQILELFQQVFGKEKTLKHWIWEFKLNPYGTQIMLGFHFNKLVAQCAAIPVMLYAEGKLLKGAQLVDCMSHPRYRAIAVRKKGIFAITVQSFFDEFTGKGKDAYLFGFPSYRHYRLGKLLLGYRKVRPISEIVIQPDENGKPLLKELHKKEMEQFENLIEKFAEEDAGLLKFCLFKSWRYVKWRYLENPVNQYRFLALKPNKGRKPKAFCVVKEEEDAVLVMDIFNLKLLPEVLKGLRKHFKKPLKMWIPQEHPLTKALDTIPHKIREPEVKAVPVGRSFDEESLNWDWANENFFYTMGDSDLF